MLTNQRMCCEADGAVAAVRTESLRTNSPISVINPERSASPMNSAAGMIAAPRRQRISASSPTRPPDGNSTIGW